MKPQKLVLVVSSVILCVSLISIASSSPPATPATGTEVVEGYNGVNFFPMSVDANGVLNVNGPLSGLSDTQTAAAGQVIGMGIFNGTSWDRLQGNGGAANVAVPSGVALNAGSALIGQVNVVPSATAALTISQIDFSSGGGSAGCQNVSVYPLAPATNSNNQCYIVKGTSGVLLSVEWNSLSNIVNLTGGASITCYDNTSNSGRPVWQAQPAAGEYKSWYPYGRPFSSLTCKSSAAVPGSSGLNVLEVETK
ncbi:MAG TPA: hypothetical protein VFO25_08395 [Candidatus Eremiobacteraceae bacterium]|nr:hypothetical protein [Candidatus Eremiobacteraceae bacterium]